MRCLFPAFRAAVAAAARGGRRGVGLIIALGLLSLLMITGVSFAILMRVERAGSANLRHATAARQMAKGGLNYAIAAILQDQSEALKSGQTAVWTNRRFEVATGTLSPPRTAQETQDDVLWIDDQLFISQDQSKSKNQYGDVSLARVLSADLSQYLPAADRERAERIRMDGRDYASPEWVPVVVGGSPIGRYAFIALETTGRLDANLVHAADRWMGGSPAEIRLDKDVVLDVNDALKFANTRKVYGRYETIPELARNPGIDGDELANFDVFSYGLPDRIPQTPAVDTPEARSAHNQLYPLTKGRRVDIGDLHDFASFDGKKQQALKDQITLAFKASGMNPDQANWAYLGLLDYADADNEPAGDSDAERWGRPATEAMPLFSQVVLNVRYEQKKDLPPDADGNPMVGHRMHYTFAVVYTYPFQTQTGPFKLNANLLFAMFTDAKWAGLGPDAPLKFTLDNNNVTCRAGDEPVSISKTISYPASGYEIKKQDEGECTKADLFVVANARTLNGNGKTIRQSPFDQADVENSQIIISVGFTPQDFTYAKNDTAYYWCEAIDPRYNHRNTHVDWRASRWDGEAYVWDGADATAPLDKLKSTGILPNFVLPDPPGPLFGLYGRLAEHVLTTPEALRKYLKIYTDGVRIGDDNATHCDPIDRQVRAHVADQPLRSVGELGYIPIGLWLTINLIDHGHNPHNLSNNNYPNNTLPSIGYHPVLDYFTIGDPDKPRWGRVNLNAASEEVLGAVFNQLPLRTEANTPASPGPVIPAKAQKKLDDAYELGAWLYDRGPFTRLSDLGRLFRGTPQIGISSIIQAYNNPDPLQALQESTMATPVKGFGEFEREALVRNACELLTMRGRTFTIVLRADAFAPSFGMSGVKQGNVLSTAMAVAQVWCDTEKDAGGQYPSFVQFFKILNE